MKQKSMYVDTSVIGGVFDQPFEFGCRKFFDLVLKGRYLALISDITHKELQQAPEKVRVFFANLPSKVVSFCPVTDEVKNLASKYIEAGVLSIRSIQDATHVAVATVYKADCIVSCNFKHLVNLEKIAGFNAVNLANGYGNIIDIRKPEEVLIYEEE